MTIGPKTVKQLNGHSGSEIYLMEKDNILFVRKVGNTKRNQERLQYLNEHGFSVPAIYNIDGDTLDMEYIHGLDIKTYLISNNTKNLKYFITSTLKFFAAQGQDKDYTETYHQKLSWLDDTHGFPFTKQELIDKLPKILPSSQYHGDMTLENLIATENGFFMIDPVTIEYDSYIFDIAKMRQDLECRWFLRNEDIRIGAKLSKLQQELLKEFPLANNDYLLILMLLRVYLHTTKGDDNYNFIMKEINRLWI
jgi:RIO-like serine/threonine protein kinase